MKDDYLWDGSGEPDPEIERLESLLSRYRHQGQAPQAPVKSARFFAPKLAVAAAVILVALAGLWLVLQRVNVRTAEQENATNVKPGSAGEMSEVPQKTPEKIATPEEALPTITPVYGPRRRTPPVENRAENKRDKSAARPVSPSSGLLARGSEGGIQGEAAGGVALVDFEVANHLERAQMLLQSFRNTAGPDSTTAPDVSYEKERSRDLLAKNVLLRRDAEAKGNNQVGRVLGSLEPLLLDIANLPAKPAAEDITAIKDRIQKTEMVATLQVHSAMLATAAY